MIAFNEDPFQQICPSSSKNNRAHHGPQRNRKPLTDVDSLFLGGHNKSLPYTSRPSCKLYLSELSSKVLFYFYLESTEKVSTLTSCISHV